MSLALIYHNHSPKSAIFQEFFSTLLEVAHNVVLREAKIREPLASEILNALKIRGDLTESERNLLFVYWDNFRRLAPNNPKGL
jgi:hypothetical protein